MKDMSYASAFSLHMEGLLRHKEALGYSAGSYVWYLKHFDRFCIGHFPKQAVLTQELVLEYACAQKGETINTLNRRLATVRELARYMQSLGIPAYLLPPKMTPGQTRYVPHLFTDEELSLFFSAIDHLEALPHDSLVQYAVPVMFRMLYCCGLRPGEVRLIRTEDIELSTGRLYIRESKRHKDRVVLLAEDLLRLCDKYDGIRRRYDNGGTWFFPNRDGSPRSTGWLAYQFKKAWKTAGIKEFSAPKPRVYDFRHTFATRKLYQWMEAGEDLYQRLPYLSAYMGHSQFSATAYYIHLLPQRLISSTAINWQSFADLLPEVSS